MKKIIRIVIIIILFIVIFVILNMLFQPKYATNLVEGSMISQYYREVKDHEVIFIGDCELYANFSPMVMYETSGIKAYIRGSSQQLIWQSYIILKETLKYETPKVVVFNVNAIRYDKSSDKVNEAYNRLTIDKMKWSKEKVEIIKESITDTESFMSYVFPILRYHSRYNQLTKEDFEYLFKKKDNTYNGFLVNKGVKGVTNLPTEKKLANYNFSEESYHYLELILKLCEENDIELVLVKAPSLYPYWYDEYYKQIKDFALENSLDYYNLKDYVDVIGIDYSQDTYDGGLHLNLTGATKLSEYFARLLSPRYDLTNYKGDSIYDEKLKNYKKEIKIGE
ncbi:MAG: SGNH/GDSL hydrolase family protein [Bacilli bacterium]|nr:SGNH/GDSL hydrolase family protein [Bacilli bacterium]MDD4809474.1 SGNH/GDSL hydrolase family protein [Bacilli bacterium]